MLFVGDFYQHTFDTSRDGATNSTLFNSKAKYESRFTAKGFICDNTSLVNSWRCSKNVCQFYTTSEVYTIFGMASVNIWNPWFYSGEVWARAIGQWFRAVPVFGRAWWNCYEIVIFQWQRIILPQAHQGFPGFFSSEIFLFFHWWQTPFLRSVADLNRDRAILCAAWGVVSALVVWKHCDSQKINITRI